MSRPRPRRRLPFCVLAPIAVAGCSLGPAYTRPSVEIPAKFVATAPLAGPTWPDPGWWKGFGSPELDALIAAAEAQNFDIAAALARVREADANVRIAGAALLPTLNAGAGTSYTQEGLGSRGAGSAAFGRTSSGTIVTHSYSTNLNAAYVTDFWGRYSSAAKAAKALAAFSRFDVQTVRLTVLTSVAQTWFTVLELADRLHVAEQNLDYARRSLAVIEGRLAVGTGTALQRDQQAALLAAEEATIPGLRSNLQQQLIGLGILTGRPAETIKATPGTLTALKTPPVAPGLPSGLLERRPDIASAEAQLVAANYDIAAARAAFFPQIALTAERGYVNAALGALFTPGGLLATAAASLTQPIFDGGALRGRLNYAKGRYDELTANYRKAVLQAFTDVELALTGWHYASEQEALQQKAVTLARQAAEAALAQLQAGTADVTTLLTTETALLNDEDALVQIRLSRLLALLDLYKALGGGWQAPAGGVEQAFPGLDPGPVTGGFALPVGLGGK